MKPEFKVDKYAIRWKRRNHLSPRVSDFLRYTFTPAISMLLIVSALVVMIQLTFCALANLPGLAVALFAFYCAIFLVLLLVSYRGWKRYRSFYNEVFRK